MPHDWTKVEAGIFHAFHHDWITEIARALNQGRLPADYYALPEQIAGEFGPDVLTLHVMPQGRQSQASEGLSAAVALADAPPKVQLRMRSESRQYAAKAKGVVVRHVSNHRIVAMIEIVSPGNKDSQTGLNAFVRKAREALAAGIHLLIVDLFRAGPRDPQGIHRAIWGDDCGADYSVPSQRPLTCVSYLAGASAEAFVEFAAIGLPLPQMPLFLSTDVYVLVPLETSYQAAWQSMPQFWRKILAP